MVKKPHDLKPENSSNSSEGIIILVSRNKLKKPKPMNKQKTLPECFPGCGGQTPSGHLPSQESKKHTNPILSLPCSSVCIYTLISTWINTSCWQYMPSGEFNATGMGNQHQSSVIKLNFCSQNMIHSQVPALNHTEPGE